ncbi:MAG: hypothetical protein ABI056_09375, partial [Caulobacteraceae bacterium]
AVIDLRAEDCDDEAELRGCGLRFLHLPTADMMGVSQPMLDKGVRFAADASGDGLKLLIHCEHGIGRSALLALCVLVDRGLAPLAALTAAKDSRALVSPSEVQFLAWSEWITRRSTAAPPDYREFGLIAYRHLNQPA